MNAFLSDYTAQVHMQDLREQADAYRRSFAAARTKMNTRKRLHTISALIGVVSLVLIAVAPAAGAAAPVVRCFGRASTILGTPGDDQGTQAVVGSSRADVISALEGNDEVYAGAGNDFACGNSGNDIVSGEGGADSVTGDVGNDSLAGGPGNDKHFGGPGNDEIIIYAQGSDRGADQGQGGPGDDVIYAEDGVGNDTVDGGESANDYDTCFVDQNDSYTNCEAVNPPPM